MILSKIKNLNYLLIFLLILLSFIGAAGLYSAADGSYQPWAAKHLFRFYTFLLIAILISMIDIKLIYKFSGLIISTLLINNFDSIKFEISELSKTISIFNFCIVDELARAK